MISIDWVSGVIDIPKTYTTLVQSSPEIRELDTNQLRKDLSSELASEEGIVFPDTHLHITQVNLGGVVYARFVVMQAPYTITLEDGQYATRLIGSNNNLEDVVNINQVSLRTSNSAGLIVSGSGVTAQDLADIADKVLVRNVAGGSDGGHTVSQSLKANRNRVDMINGVVYEEDGVTVSHTFDVTRDELDAVSEVNPT